MPIAMPMNDLGWNLRNTYARLPSKLHASALPAKAERPKAIIISRSLATELGLTVTDANEAALISTLAGSGLPEGSEPIAQAYAGHQFGHFTMLGDGRAILLGEQQTPDGRSLDIQLKGCGRTPFSRGGDGLATVSAMLREYLISEAMHHLGIPTTRSLAVMGTGAEVYRDEIYPGAVLTRVAQSHLRVGTFEFVNQFLTPDVMQQLVTYTIERHYPELKEAENPAIALLQAVMERQVALVVHWMRVGFIHGVMNTDNMSIAGETIDYGPCAFMNTYHPATVFSSIDRQGRYAFGNQPRIAQWNLSCLAGALLPLVDADKEKAIAKVREVLDSFTALYDAQWLGMMRGKLGLTHAEEGDLQLADDLLNWMKVHEADYTNIFRALRQSTVPQTYPAAEEAFLKWRGRWVDRVLRNEGGMDAAQKLMARFNPFIVPRNHKVEEALAAAQDANDMGPLHRLLDALKDPYVTKSGYDDLLAPPDGGDAGYRTYCGT